MDAQYTDTQDQVRRTLAPLVSADELILTPDELELFARDVFFEGRLPLAILRPESGAALAPAIAALSRAGIPIAARGSGLSYSGGYVSSDTHMVIVDLTRLNAVEHIDPAGQQVTVQAGCTWATLHAALKPLGLRTPFWGPSSGLHATIGGTLSQDAVLFGSGHFGAAGVNTISMLVITPDGTQRTLVRNEDPALFSAFIGDCGVLGIKTRVTLPLIPAHGALEFAALSFSSLEGAAAALKEIGKKGLASECFLYDQTFRTRLRGQAKPDSANITEPVPGHRYPSYASFELHAAIEGEDANDCDRIRTILLASASRLGGRPIGKGVLSAFREAPFSAPTLMIGPQGRRWLPTNFIVPHEQMTSLLSVIKDVFVSHRTEIETYDITWSWSALGVGRDHVLIEPSLYWEDELTPLSRLYLDAELLDRQPIYPPDPQARQTVSNLRSALIKAGERVNARHIQVGRTYPASATYSPKDNSEFQALKRKLDPRDVMNPGAVTF